MKASILWGVAILFAGPVAAFQTTPPPNHAASQIHSSADAQLQASVRKAIADDTSLSDSARHATVIVSDGAVVLRGKAKDDKEKTRIEQLVRNVAGVKELTNELELQRQL